MTKTKEIRIEKTYMLDDSYDLFEILKKIEKTDYASFSLSTNGIQLKGSLVTTGGIESCSYDLARIVNGEYVGKDDDNLYLQIYNEDDIAGAHLSKDECLKEIRPDYLDILRKFIG